jgi:hypothetical protein
MIRMEMTHDYDCTQYLDYSASCLASALVKMRLYGMYGHTSAPVGTIFAKLYASSDICPRHL